MFPTAVVPFYIKTCLYVFAVSRQKCIFLFFLYRATSVAYGSSQARGQIGAAAVTHSCLQPQQCQIQATSATYTTAHGNPRSLTH